MTSPTPARRSVMELLGLTETMVDFLARLADKPGWNGLPRQRYAATVRALRQRGLVAIMDPRIGPELNPKGREAAKLLGLLDTPIKPTSAPAPFTGTVADALNVLTAALGAPAPPPPVEDIVIGDEAALSTLVAAERDIVGRIVERAQYVALREMLKALDGWIEGARENNEALGRHDDPQVFHAEDIRSMVNDAARVLGVREPHRDAS
jgi:hypothetical protein